MERVTPDSAQSDVAPVEAQVDISPAHFTMFNTSMEQLEEANSDILNKMVGNATDDHNNWKQNGMEKQTNPGELELQSYSVSNSSPENAHGAVFLPKKFELLEIADNILEKKHESENGIPIHQLYKATQRLKKEKKVWEMIFWFIFVLMFMYLILFMRHTAEASETIGALKDMFVQEEFTEIEFIMDTSSSHSNMNVSIENEQPFFRKTFLDIRTIEEYWLWFFGPLMKGLYPELSGSFTMNNKANINIRNPVFGLPLNGSQIYVMGSKQGGVVVRQSRVEAGESCKDFNAAFEDFKVHLVDQCYGPWREAVNDNNPFGPDGDESGYLDGFTYTDFNETLKGGYVGIQSPFFFFSRNDYGTGGYGIEMSYRNGTSATQQVRKLLENNWIDVATRVVSVAFNTYNPTNNIIATCKFTVEFGASGIVKPIYRIYSLNAAMWSSYYNGTLGFVAALFFLLLAMYTFFWFDKLFRSSDRVEYLLRFATVVDAVVLLIYWIIVFWIIGMTISSDAMLADDFKETIERPNYHGKLFDSAYTMHYLDGLCSINVVLSIIKLISFVPFKSVMVIWLTLGDVFKDVLVLFCVIFLFWFAFAFGAHLTFGTIGFDEFNRETTFGTLVLTMFSGEFNFDELRQVTVISAALFYGTYMIFMWGVMLNLFVAIVVIAYEKYANTRRDYDEWVASSVTISTNYAQNIVFNSFLRFVECCKLSFFVWHWKRQGRKLNIPDALLDLTLYKAEKVHLFDQMAEVMKAKIIERYSVAKQHHLPYCRYWKRVVQKLIRQMRSDVRFCQFSEISDVKVRINELYKNKSDILKTWEHNLALEAAKQRKRLIDLGLNCRARESKQQRKLSIFRGKWHPIISSDELKQWERTGEKLNYRLERYTAKVSIEKSIRMIKNRYWKENLSFSKLLREVWLGLKDDEKLVFLSVEDLAAIMSPNQPGANASQEELKLAVDLIRHYQVICRHKRKTLKRFPQLSPSLVRKLKRS